MKFVLIAVLAAIAMAHFEYEHVQDWRNASYNVSEFMQGFAYGAFEESIGDIAHCANDSLDIIQTFQRDIKPIIEGNAIAKATAITDLIWHMVRDIPEILSTCGHIGNGTIDIIHVTKEIFNEIINFKQLAHDLFVNFGPATKLITSAAIAIEQGDWYKGGLNIGKVFRIIAHKAVDATKQVTQ